MKLTKEKIDSILDDASGYIYDDLWNEFDEGWIEDYLNDEGLEYDKEDVIDILKGLKETQKEFQEQTVSEEKQDLYQAIDEFIDDYDIHLSLDDVGKVLVKLAASYLNCYEG